MTFQCIADHSEFFFPRHRSDEMSGEGGHVTLSKADRETAELRIQWLEAQRYRALWMALRQALIIALGAIEDYLEMPRSIVPKRKRVKPTQLICRSDQAGIARKVIETEYGPNYEEKLARELDEKQVKCGW